MNIKIDQEMLWLLGGVMAILVLATGVGLILKLLVTSEPSKATIKNLNARIRAWWVMYIVFIVASFIGKIGSVVLFGLTSFLALREFITLTPTRRADHRSLFWVFF